MNKDSVKMHRTIAECFDSGQDIGHATIGRLSRLSKKTIVILVTFIFGFAFFLYGFIKFKEKKR
jgi:hypothetical protein